VWPGGAERLDLGIAGMESVLADDAVRFGSAVGSVRWLKYALFHLALPAGGGWAGEPDRSWKNHGATAEVPDDDGSAGSAAWHAALWLWAAGAF
jgi:hypothetical protein